jgi:hypothetical protein
MIEIGAAVLSVVVISIVLIAYYRPEYLLSSTFVGIGIFGAISISAIAFLNRRASTVPGANDPSSTWLTLYVIVIGVVCFMLVLYTGLKTSGVLTQLTRLVSPTITGYILNILLAGIVLYGLATYQVIFSDYLRKIGGWTGFIINLIFAIPCYLSNMVRYALQEYATTPRVVAVLLAIEILLILAYVYLPKLIEKTQAMLVPGIPIQKDIVYLNRKVVLPNNVHTSTRQKLVEQPTASLSDMGTNQMYAFTMWIYVIPVDIGMDQGTDQDTNTIGNISKLLRDTTNTITDTITDTITENMEAPNSASANSGTKQSDKYTLFRFGSASDPSRGAPWIRYAGSHQAPYTGAKQRGDYWRVSMSGLNSEDALVPVASQKWNHVAVNYANNGADLFVNGVLVHHQTFTPEQLPVYADDDVFVLGGDNNHGLGAIRDIVYYDRPISQQFIQSQMAMRSLFSSDII